LTLSFKSHSFGHLDCSYTTRLGDHHFNQIIGREVGGRKVVDYELGQLG
jgi:hypothetical protein